MNARSNKPATAIAAIFRQEASFRRRLELILGLSCHASPARYVVNMLPNMMEGRVSLQPHRAHDDFQAHY